MKRTNSTPAKKTYRKKRQSTKAIVYKAVQNQIQRNAEKKFYDENYTITGLNITGSTNAMFEPTAGTGVNDIIGIKGTITSVEVNVTLISPGLATTNPYNQTRITIFTWKGQNVPALLDLYTVSTINFMTISPFNPQTKKLRKIHYDEVFDQYYVPANNFAEHPLKTIKIYIPMANKKGKWNEIQFDAVGVTNQLYCFIVANNNGAANTQWDAYVTSRCTFLDM